MKKAIRVILLIVFLVTLFTLSNVSYGETVKQNRLAIDGVTASSDDGNVPTNTIDGIRDTRWSAKGTDEWIHYDFGSEQIIDYVGVAFYKGDIRYTHFDILISTDDVHWTKVFSGHGSGTTLDMERFDIEKATARYVKLICHGYDYTDGSKTGLWNSLNDVHFYSSDELAMDKMDSLEAEVPVTITYTKAGFYEGILSQDNKETPKKHQAHQPNAVTGTTLNVVDFGVDLSNNTTNDAKAIQAAINAAKYGDEVYLPNGIYNLQSDGSYGLLLKSGVNLRGESKEGVKLLSSALKGNYPSGVVKIMGQNDICISNMTLTSDFSGNYSMDHKINNPEADGPRYMIQIEDDYLNRPSYNITMDQLLIEKYQTMGVRISTSHDVVVRHSIFQNATDIGGGGAGYGVSIQGEGNNKDRLGYKNDSRFNLIENCTFKGPYLRHGALIQYYAHNNVIRDNTFIQTKLDAIDLHGEDEYLNEIVGNEIRNIETGAGVGVGNTGATHDRSGSGNYIHNNYIENCREGIKVHLGSENTVIKNNTITGSTVNHAKGIYIQNAPGTIIEENSIDHNTSKDFWAIFMEYDPGTDGRGYGGPDNICITGNTIKNCTNGVSISAGTNIAMNNNRYVDILNKQILDTRTYGYTGDQLPSQILDLTNWKLTLPINNAQEILQPELMGYEHKEHFYTNGAGDSVTFKAHCGGETTGGSSYPRSELREMTNNGTEKASWSTHSGKHSMTIDQNITHLPDVKKHVVVGQIHDASDDVIMIRLEKNQLLVEAEGVKIGVLDSDYQLGTRFTVRMEVEKDIVKVFYNNVEKVIYDVKDSPTTAGQSKNGCYFKAGMYTQSNTSKGDEPSAYGEVQVYDLVVTHWDSSSSNSLSLIPNREADNVINPVMDTYIELSSKKPGVNPYNTKDTMYIKMSGGQTTIRMGFITFDKKSITESIHAAQLKLTKHSIKKADSVISIYGYANPLPETVIWTDLFTADSRYSKNDNRDIPIWLNKNAVKLGVINFGLEDGMTDYTLNVSEFVNEHLDADQFTFVLVDEVGANSDLKIGSSEKSSEISRPELRVWYPSTDSSEDSLENTSTPIDVNLDAEALASAYALLTYDTLLTYHSENFITKSLSLPTVIGDDVKVKWSSGNSTIVNNDGIVHPPAFSEGNRDVTLTAVLSKNNEEGSKEFVFVVKENAPFSDVDNVSWAVESIEALTARKIIHGTSGGTFNPNERLKKEEYVKMIISTLDILDEMAVSDFTDVEEGKWYCNYIATAQKKAIIHSREDGSFGIHQPITKLEMIDIASRATPINRDQLIEVMRIVEKMDKHSSIPSEYITRAQAAVFIYEVYQHIN